MPEVFGEVSVRGIRLTQDDQEDAINVPIVFDAVPNEEGKRLDCLDLLSDQIPELLLVHE